MMIGGGSQNSNMTPRVQQQRFCWQAIDGCISCWDVAFQGTAGTCTFTVRVPWIPSMVNAFAPDAPVTPNRPELNEDSTTEATSSGVPKPAMPARMDVFKVMRAAFEKFVV